MLSPEVIKQQTLQWHHQWREIHLASRLEWSEDCFQAARLQAEACSAQGRLFQSDLSSGEYGQNVWASQKGARPEDAIKAWYKGQEEYDFEEPYEALSELALQFTQLVWSSTTHVGLAISKDELYIVANYWPAGNQHGKFAANVNEAIHFDKAVELVADSEVEKIGMFFSTLPPKALVVKKVVPGSWAAQVGVHVGDMFMSVNGIPVHELTAEAFKKMMVERPLTLILPTSCQQTSVVKLQRLFRGRLAKEEVVKRKKTKERRQRLLDIGLRDRYDVTMAVFKLLDQSHEGRLTEKELLRFVRMLGILDVDEDMSEIYPEIAEAYSFKPEDGLSSAQFIKMVNDKEDDWYRTDDQMAELHEQLEFEASLKPRPGRRGEIGRGVRMIIIPFGVLTKGMTMSVPPRPIQIKQVLQGGWADKVGLEVGDTFMEVNGIPVYMLTPEEFKAEMKKRPLRLRIADEDELKASVKIQTLLRMKLAKKTMAEERQVPEIMSQIFRRLDSNKDEKLDKQELLVLVRSIEDYKGSDQGWFEDFSEMCGEYGFESEIGLTLQQFIKFFHGREQERSIFYCSVSHLRDFLRLRESESAAASQKSTKQSVAPAATRKGAAALMKGLRSGEVSRLVDDMEEQPRQGQLSKTDASRRNEEKQDWATTQTQAGGQPLSKVQADGGKQEQGAKEIKRVVKIQESNEKQDQVERNRAVEEVEEKRNAESRLETEKKKNDAEDRDSKDMFATTVQVQSVDDKQNAENQAAAALKIQSVQRGRIGRKEARQQRKYSVQRGVLKTRRKRNEAAKKIQSVQRGRMARAQVKEQRIAFDIALEVDHSDSDSGVEEIITAENDSPGIDEMRRLATMHKPSAADRVDMIMAEFEGFSDSDMDDEDLVSPSTRRESISSGADDAENDEIQSASSSAQSEVWFNDPEYFLHNDKKKRQAGAIKIQKVFRGRRERKGLEKRRDRKDQLERLFNRLDENKDSLLTMSEFFVYAERMGFATGDIISAREDFEDEYGDICQKLQRNPTDGLDLKSFKFLANEEEGNYFIADEDLQEWLSEDPPKQEKAGIGMQNVQPGSLARQRLAREMFSSGDTVHGTGRGVVNSDVQNEAATRIQSVQRGRVERKKLADQRNAAQSSHLTPEVFRKTSSQVFSSMSSDASRRERAAVQIQSAQRARMARQEVADMRAFQNDVVTYRSMGEESDAEFDQEFASVENDYSKDYVPSRQERAEARMQDEANSKDFPKHLEMKTQQSLGRMKRQQRADEDTRISLPDKAEGGEATVPSNQHARKEDAKKDAGGGNVVSMKIPRAMDGQGKTLDAGRLQVIVESPVSALPREQQLEALFRYLDKNNDGLLLLSEFFVFAHKMGFDEDEEDFNGEYQLICQTWQCDPEFGIDLMDFIDIANDEDGNYNIDDKALQAWLSELGISVEPTAWAPIGSSQLPSRTELLQAVFSILDRNKDGLLNFSEFYVFAQRNGFEEDEEDFDLEYEDTCQTWQCDPEVGIDLTDFIKIANDDDGNYNIDDESLQAWLSELGISFEKTAAGSSHLLSRAEKLQAVFEALDKDKNGALNLSELFVFAQIMGFDDDEEDFDEEYEDTCQTLQIDPDVGLSLTDFIEITNDEGGSYNIEDDDLQSCMYDFGIGTLPLSGSLLERPRRRRSAILADIFRSFDLNSDGMLQQAEMLHFARALQFPGSEEDFAEVFSELCSDHGLDIESGFDLESFTDLLSDKYDKVWFCSDDQLDAVLEKNEQGNYARQSEQELDETEIRASLINQLFQDLDVDGDYTLNERELYQFARCFDFPGTVSDWTQVYTELCVAYQWDPEIGVDLGMFTEMVDEEKESWYATNEKLNILLQRLEAERSAVVVQSNFRGHVLRKQMSKSTIRSSDSSLAQDEPKAKQDEPKASPMQSPSSRVPIQSPSGRILWRKREVISPKPKSPLSPGRIPWREAAARRLQGNSSTSRQDSRWTAKQTNAQTLPTSTIGRKMWRKYDAQPQPQSQTETKSARTPWRQPSIG